MQQIIQNQKTGELVVDSLPAPRLRSGGVLIQNAYSLVSAGTERASVKTAQASLLGKARSRPDLVRQVLDEVKRNGVVATYQKVQSRLNNYKELGYSSAGTVIASAVDDFRPGDRVACGGVGYAAHAEQIFVPRHLVAEVPEAVSLEEASFATLGAIALQGVRQADVHVGESVAVIGLGLIGLLTVQLLKASGCQVIGLDISEGNFALARKLGCDQCLVANWQSVLAVEALTRGRGTDAVIITAATKSSQPVELALQYARKKSKLVVVGAVAMNIPRSPFYEKELDVRISCSYGPGRYDAAYEEGGHDYPIAYVRWTENRNMQAVLELMAQRKLDVRSLITHRFSVADGLGAYDLIAGNSKEKYLGILIEYAPHNGHAHFDAGAANSVPQTDASPHEPVVGFVGAGNFAQAQLLPRLQQMHVRLRGVATARPVSAASTAKKFRFEYAVTNPHEILGDSSLDTVFIATRHHLHAALAMAALEAGKTVFVEKPLALSWAELEDLCKVHERSSGRLMVGFNRRFAPLIQNLGDFFAGRSEPLTMVYRINAGYLPKEHWYHDPLQGGGRLLGEACHFIDLLSHLANAPVQSVYAECMDDAGRYRHDNVVINLRFGNGSIGTVIYAANGDSQLPKERLEIFGQGSTAILDDFQRLELYRDRQRRVITSRKQDKGHAEEVRRFIEAQRQGDALPISFETCVQSTAATLAARDALRLGVPLWRAWPRWSPRQSKIERVD